VYMGGVSRAAFTAQRDRVVLADTNGNARVFEFTPNYQDLLASARRQAVRCLTEDERATFRLSTAVPDWCVAQNKWPYIATHARIEKAH
jgi:hypothetical protein